VPQDEEKTYSLAGSAQSTFGIRHIQSNNDNQVVEDKEPSQGEGVLVQLESDLIESGLGDNDSQKGKDPTEDAEAAR
jgi:hypothetical protein